MEEAMIGAEVVKEVGSQSELLQKIQPRRFSRWIWVDIIKKTDAQWNMTKIFVNLCVKWLVRDMFDPLFVCVCLVFAWLYMSNKHASEGEI